MDSLKLTTIFLIIPPPFSSILLAINTPTYKLAKFLETILKCFASREFTVKNSLAFAKEIIEQDSKLFYGKPRC